MSNFADLGLPEKILTALNAIHFNTPTPIQQQSIPVALQGHDILGSAQTGTGKTAAFAIPMIVHLLENPLSCALVLLPTRELAQQVISLVVAENKLMLDVDVKDIKPFQMNMLDYFATKHPEIGKEIEEKKVLSDELKDKILEVAKEYKSIS